MIEVAMVAVKILCAVFLVLGSMLSMLRTAKAVHPASGSYDLEHFNYAVANDFETDFRRVHARRSVSRTAAA